MIDIRSLDFTLLLTFEAIYEERSITRAAHRLAVTQPAVSGSLTRLRKLFDDPLFVRKQGGMIPTPRADNLAPQIKQLLAAARDVLAPEDFDPRRANFRLRISANDYGQKVVLQPLITQLRRVAPRVQVGVLPFETIELGERFQRGQIDIAVTIPEMAPADYPARFLFSDRYIAVVRKRHPIKSARVDLDSFCNFPHILVSPTGGSFEAGTDAALRRIGRRREVALSVPSFRFALDLVQSDNFIAVLPSLLLSKQDLRIVRMMELPIDIKGPDAIIAWHPRLHDDHAHIWLRDQIVTIARAQSSVPA